MKLMLITLIVISSKVSHFVSSTRSINPNLEEFEETESESSNSPERNLDNANINNSETWYHPEAFDVEATKTFERVVLEGSNIIISCPTSVTFSPFENSLIEVQTNTKFSRQEQFSPAYQLQEQEPSFKAYKVPSKVKWFRNHVPLVKLDDLQQSTRDDSYVQASTHTLIAPNIKEINWTGEQNQPASTFTIRNKDEGRDDYSRWQIRAQGGHLLSSSSYPPAQFLEVDRDSSTIENVNELGISGIREFAATPQGIDREGAEEVRKLGKEKQGDKKEVELSFEETSTKSRNSHWYINKIGELVINEVSQYFAGKYTCLANGKQSEVLVDVLVENGLNTNQNQEQAFEIEKTSSIRPFSFSRHSQPSTPFPSSTSHSLKLNSAYKNNNLESRMEFVYQEAGNSPIEKGKSFELEASTNSNASTSLFDKFKKQDEQKLRDNSLVDDNTSLEANSIKVLVGDTTRFEQKAGSTEQLLPVQTVRENENGSLGEKEARQDEEDVEMNSLKDIDDNLLEKDKPMNLGLLETLPSRYSNAQQRHPVHVVKSEAIQINDLKFVPGFLYTKQQLYCPVPEKIGTHFYTLIHTICHPMRHPKQSATIAASGVFTTDGKEELKCQRLAERLIWKILAASAALDDEGQATMFQRKCPALVSELIWFKDGKQLMFDTNGRETSLDLNVKLINFFDQFNIDTASENGILAQGEKIDHSYFPSSNAGANANGIRVRGSINNGEFARNRRSPKQRTCPTVEGRVLEIDGLRKESSGRYTCAFRLSTSKMNQIVRNLERLNKPNLPLNRDGNDISCCDELPSTPEMILKESRQKEQPALPSVKIETRKIIKRGDSITSFDVSTPLYKQLKGEKGRENSNSSFLAKQNYILESILEGNVSSKQSLSFIKQSLSRFKNPIRTIQTFSLNVVEHPANSCDLWSTITEAAGAYTRRKLADFKRLRRNLDVERKATKSLVNPSSLNGQKVYSEVAWQHNIDDVGRSSAARLSNTLSRNDGAAAIEHTTVAHKSPYANQELGSLNELEKLPKGAETLIGIGRQEYKMSVLKHPNQAGVVSESELESEKRYEEPFNVHHLTPDSTDRERTVLAGHQENGKGSTSDSLRVNNYDADELGIEVGSEQTKVLEGARKNTKHFYYANEKNLDLMPIYATAAATGNADADADGDITRSKYNRAVSRTVREIHSSIKSEAELKRPKRAIYGSRIRVDHRNLLDAAVETEMSIDPITQRAFEASLGGHNVDTLPSERRATSATTTFERDNFLEVIDDAKQHQTVRGLATIIDDNLAAQERGKEGDKIKTLEDHKKNEPIRIDLDKRTGNAGGGKSDATTATRQSWWLRDKIRELKKGEEKENLQGENEEEEENHVDSLRQGYGLQEDKLPLFGNAAKNHQSDRLSSQLNSFTTQSGASMSTDYNIKYAQEEEFDSIDQLSSSNSGQSKEVILPADSKLQRANTETAGENTNQMFLDVSSVANDKKKYWRNGIRRKMPLNVSPITTAGTLSNENVSDDDGLNESLMWTAGQYLYMHMKAIAASSMFGVEVSVEWSNERANGTNIDLSHQEEYSQGDYLTSNDDEEERNPDAAPFATIDVISGQNLHLQCTAQALGRLPKVKWYKRVHTIPFQLKGLVKLARRIGHDIFWPLSELYLLDAYEINSRREPSFVCSQTNAIFDNLANQTFTVISSLQLSQYNDEVTSTSAVKSSSLINSNYNLYACIVDADIRRNYATLAVNFRKAPSKISLEISKRLQARSAFTKSTDPSSVRTSISAVEQALEQEKQANFDLYQQNTLRIPLKSYWLPIQNGSSVRKQITSGNTILVTPSILTAVILFVFSSTIALIYLTVRKYRSLTNSLPEDGLTDQSNYSNDSIDSMKRMQSYTHKDTYTMKNSNNYPARCFCHIEHQLDELTINEIQRYSGVYNAEPFLKHLDNLQRHDLVNETNQSFYEAHYDTHNVQLHYSCHELNSPLIAELPSNQIKSTYSYKQQMMPSCDHMTLMATTTPQPLPHHQQNIQSQTKISMDSTRAIKAENI